MKPFPALTALGLALALAASSTAVSAAAGPNLTVVGRIPGPDGGWDYANFDAARRKVYITRGDTVMVIDVDSGKVIPRFAEGKRLHAAVPVPGTDVIVMTDSGDNTAKIVSAADGRLIAAIPTANDADGAIYDAHSGLVLVICGDGGMVDLIDPKARKSVGTIKIGTDLEFAGVDGTGRAFVNESARNAVAVLDLGKREVVATWPLPNCQRPTGLVYAEGQVISACGAGMADILDAATGKPLASLKIGGFPDAVIYDARLRMAYIPSALSGTLAVIPVSGPGKDTIIETVSTETGARTGAVDPRTGRIYLPAAQYELPAPVGQRPVPKPGTFEVLVVGRP